MPVRIFPWPVYSENPYVPRFRAALERQGLQVVHDESLRRGCARLRPGDWLHLQWPAQACLHRWRWVYRVRLARFASLLRRLLARGVRVAWTAHNLLPHDDPHPDLGRACRRLVLDAVEFVFVHFPTAVRSLDAEFGWRGPVVHIPHGHYVDDFPAPPSREAARRELGVPEAAFAVLFFGLVRPYKGLGEVVRGFLSIARPQDRLLVAGNPEGDVERELALARSDPRVLLDLRYVPAPEIPRWFAAADVFVVAYREFFTSGSAVLSLSLGCPVLAPAIHHLAHLGGPPRVFAVEPTAARIAEALVRMRDSPPVDHLALRRWAQTSLSWDEVGSRAAEAFLGRRPAADGPQ